MAKTVLGFSLKNILIIKLNFFHYKEPLVQWKVSMDVMDSLWIQMPKKNCYFIFIKFVKRSSNVLSLMFELTH